MYNVFLLPLLLLFTLLAGNPAQAQQSSVLDSLLKGDDNFLPVDQAFKMDFRQQGDQLIVNWTIADGYYIYRDKFKYGGVAVSFSHPTYPASMQIEDEFFGVTDVYFHQLTLKIPLSDISEDAFLRIQYMGCAEAGLCYPPINEEIPLSIPGNSAVTAEADAVDPATAEESNTPTSSQYGLAERLSSGSVWLNMGVFFLLGLGLAFTPCVFPMYPILSSIIVGQGKQLSTGRAFGLSFSYVQGMALTYSALGLVVASLGVKFQAWMQHPAVLIVAAVIFVLLALAMFGVFNFQLPASWQAKVSAISNKQEGGSLKGAFVMGALSGLIASPCTTAPLSAALMYVAQSGDLMLGALTLYILSLGMGLPLILLGTSGGKLLPKAGGWMNIVKSAFGFILLLVPIILLERILPFWQIVLLASLLGLLVSGYLFKLLFEQQGSSAKASLLVSAQVLLLATVFFNWHYFSPAQTSSAAVSNVGSAPDSTTGQFIDVADLAGLEQQLAEAQAANQYTLVDLYAEWCVACKEFEKLTFPAAQVQAQTRNMRLIKIDVTKMTRSDEKLLNHYQVLGLPTLLFFSPQGEELTSARVTGFMAATPFAQHLAALTSEQ
ncbi:MAG: protein-disulfide reductase DsbD [Rheinheimera sp.]|uniref:protein-disulfide reductase DsbD n=1 Tax=Arsukibacterium sp. UBA3155 TaxID=1946058 RepID=UPI000C8C6FCD|nr:protein-disulfide reductase DsbD [Arsukibacterium sp. UBA3155]MAD74297.1 protein-disulfide reductase DsbD [Rheinheimera sp.]|tara:strand:- start:22548 stop:24365 length:1818 start_codon:yes stop_codon:yes gene_type:complete